MIKIFSVSLIGSAAIFLLLLFVKPYQGRSYFGYDRYYQQGYHAAFSGHVGCLFAFIFACLLALCGIIFLVIYLVHNKCELTVTENNVKGKTIWGKEVVLPLYMVSAYSTRKFLSTITVATSSGITKFALIKNYAEIGNVLSQKINERQENTVNQTTVSAPAPQTSAMDEFKKLKELLDAGIITQEEFDAKKKQLLGL